MRFESFRRCMEVAIAALFNSFGYMHSQIMCVMFEWVTQVAHGSTPEQLRKLQFADIHMIVPFPFPAVG